MKKLTLPIAMLVVAFYATGASAQCDFDIVKAKGVSASLVRAYAPCPGTETPTANTETESETDACTPVTPRQYTAGESSTYSFSDKGGCSGKTQAKYVKECSLLTDYDGFPLGAEPGPCHVTYVKGKCKGILDSGQALITDANDGWSFATLSRTTLNDDTNGDMTVIDFPVVFYYDTPKNGGMKLSGNSAVELAALLEVPNADLPTCTSIEVVDIVVKDPDGRPFARMGGATVPDPKLE